MDNAPYVSLIDRSPTRRVGISYLLSRQGVQVEPFEDVAEFLEFRPRLGLVLVHDEDALLTPLLDGMAREFCWYPHVVYSEEPHWRRALGAIKSGAKTYVAFPEQVDEIPAVMATLEHEVTSTEEGVVRKAHARARMGQLTRREIDVLGGVIAGGTSRIIAEKLGISSRTVEIHRGNLLRKLGAKNGADLVRISVDADFYDS
jgi:two-component system response regulator FixJ